MCLQESGEMYLETIWVLLKNSNRIRSVDVSRYMGYTKPSVSRAIGLLKKDGYLTTDECGYLHLTQLGEETAGRLYQRFAILRRFLISIGVNEKIAEKDACRMEHYMSDETFLAVSRYILKFGVES